MRKETSQGSSPGSPKGPRRLAQDKMGPEARARVSEVQGSNGHVFGNVRPSSDLQVNHQIRQNTDGDNGAEPLPLPRPDDPVMDIASVLSAAVLNSITQNQVMVFHTVGDTGGIQNPQAQNSVVQRMEQDLTVALPQRPAFFFHLGDVVYFDGQAQDYYAQFYDAYRNYNAPILAIPGNHDAELASGAPPPASLDAFVSNFCAPAPVRSPDAKDVLRTTMTQPYVYYTLNTPLATFVNIYTNTPSKGYVDPQQSAWLGRALAAAPGNKALILTLHHPVFSEDTESGGNASLVDLIDTAVNNGRHPDLVLTGHVHNYQRFTRTLADGSEYPYIVAGCGGYYDLYPVGEYTFGSKTPSPVQKGFTRQNPERTLVNYIDTNFGYMTITVTPTTITGIFQPCISGEGISTYQPIDSTLNPSQPADQFTVFLNTHKVV